ncbi:MAG: carbon-nitrogen hydrolase family protein [Actinomycetota bacterium]
MTSAPASTATHVAAVQMDGRLGDVRYNLDHVGELIAEAVGRGATVIALPEFFTTTIALDADASVRRCALPPDNAALDLLVETATNDGVLIGGSYLEQRADGHVYNCYTLVHPDGVVTRHDKDLPTMIENAFYVGGSTDGVHSTALGSVGTAVCWETIRTQTVRRLENRIDFLMTGSHWWTTATNWRGPRSFYEAADAANRALLASTPARLSRLLGVANIHSSHCGSLSALYPVVPRWRVPYETYLIGETQIVDNAGAVVARMTDADGAGVIDAHIDLSRGEPSEDLPDRFWIPDLGWKSRLTWWQQNTVAKRLYAGAQ